MRKILTFKSDNEDKRNYGTIGDRTSLSHIRVGDLVSYRFSDSNDNYYGIAVSASWLGYDSIMGSLNTNILNHRQVEVVIPYKLVTKEIANKYDMDFMESKEMTLGEIEKALGYPITLVKENV